MKQIYPDLWQSAPEHPIAEAPHVTTHAYLLLREAGNLLFYSASDPAEHRRVGELGGITHQYLSHRDEAGPALAQIRDTFGSKLVCHRLEEGAIGTHSPVDLAFDRRETHLGNLEVIPTPGHTAGSTCFLVASPEGRRYLFTGDTVFFAHGRLETLLFRKEDRADLEASLRLLRTLEPDVVLSSASVGPVAYQELEGAAWRAAVDGALRALG